MNNSLLFITISCLSYLLGAVEYTPLTSTSADRLNFSAKVAQMVNPYFSKPYEDASDKDDFFFALICPDKSKVFRPNHSLAHGMRQAYLAVDILLLLRQQDGGLFQKPDDGQELVEWVKAKLNSDKNFLKKVEMANAFQRSGRQSEISRRQNKERYESYLVADQENFLREVKKSDFGPGKLFEKEDEVEIFKEAIVKKFEKKTSDIPKDLYYLSKIFLAAHLFDLRRLPHFNKDQVYREISEVLFSVESPNAKERDFLNQLWTRTGKYLASTGDRDMDDSNKMDVNASIFCAQAHNPQLLVEALMLAKTEPEEKLLSSIVHHSQAMRQIKKRFQKPVKLPANALRENLKKAPYTTSEAYLRILLENNYIEIPKDATKEEAAKITKKNIIAFLQDHKKVADSNTQSFLPRIDNPDEYYVDILVKALMKERKHRDKVVFYHSAEPEAGFLFDVYSEMRNQLEIAGGNDIRILRAIDKEFAQFNEELQKRNSPDVPHEKATVRDFMAKFKHIGDDNNVYRTMGLSTNFSLFGSDQQEWADTYSMFFYLAEGKRLATQPLQNDKFFSYIEQYTGIPMDYRQYEPILNRYLLTCNNKPCRNGRLVQIFIDPSVVDEVAYFSVLLGAPVLKNGKTPDLSEPIALLRNSPEQIMDYLKDTKGEIVHGAHAHLLRPKRLELHDLQARLFMRPDIMLDPALVKINSYMRFDLGDMKKHYRSELEKQVNDGLIAWLKQGAPSDPDAFVAGLNKLKTLVQGVYHGSAGIDAPKEKPLSESDQLVKLLQSGRAKQAKLFFEEHFDTLINETFTIPSDQSGNRGGTTSLANLYKYVPFKELFETAFNKGLFPGKKAAYEVIQMIHPLDYRDFIDTLGQLENVELSCSLFLKHYKSHIVDQSPVSIIKTLNSLENDEEIIKESLPLLELTEFDFISKTLEGVAKLPKEDRDAIIREVISFFGEELKKSAYARVYIAGILLKVHDFHKFIDKRKKLVWSIAEQLEESLEDRLYLVDGIAATDDESLITIEEQLKNPPEWNYPDKIKTGFLEKAFDAAFAPILSLSKNRNQTKADLEQKSEYFFPKYLLKILGEEVRGLLNNESIFSSDILSPIFHLISSESYEKRKLVLAATKKIIIQWNDLGFAADMVERLRKLTTNELRMLQGMSAAEEIVKASAQFNRH